MGSKLVVSFANPAKHYETHGIRPQSTGMNVAMVGGANAKLGLRGNGALASGLLAGRPGMNGSKTGFGGRLSPSQPSFANGQGQSQLFHLNAGVELTQPVDAQSTCMLVLILTLDMLHQALLGALDN